MEAKRLSGLPIDESDYAGLERKETKLRNVTNMENYVKNVASSYGRDSGAMMDEMLKLNGCESVAELQEKVANGESIIEAADTAWNAGIQKQHYAAYDAMIAARNAAANLMNLNASLRQAELGTHGDTRAIYAQQNIVYKSYGIGGSVVYGRPGMSLSFGIEQGVIFEVDTNKNNPIKDALAFSLASIIPGNTSFNGNLLKDWMNSNDYLSYITGNATAIFGNRDIISGETANYPVAYIQGAGIYEVMAITNGPGIKNLDAAFEDTLGWTHNATVSLPFTPLSVGYSRSATGKTNDFNGGYGVGWFSGGYYPSNIYPIYRSRVKNK